MDEKLNDKIIPEGKVELIFRNVKTGIEDRYLVNNLVTSAGKASMADGLRGTTASNKGIITYCALGTDLTAPEVTDTVLGAEIFRKLVSVRSVSGNVALFETFFSIEEANGELKEAGLFGDSATSTADSGTLFCHLAISRTKTSSDTLTLRWSVSIG
ncbi:hypothetical protein KKB83_04115 [Patescibacteria group bacterium]|nr:hypothetical protein [Patescibacteria group bacterium]